MYLKVAHGHQNNATSGLALYNDRQFFATKAKMANPSKIAQNKTTQSCISFIMTFVADWCARSWSPCIAIYDPEGNTEVYVVKREYTMVGYYFCPSIKMADFSKRTNLAKQINIPTKNQSVTYLCGETANMWPINGLHKKQLYHFALSTLRAI